jgi:Kdo2-lipid IVA lauroyltransferase/acyltransferase
MKRPLRHKLEQSGWALVARFASGLTRLSLRTIRATADAWALLVMAAAPKRQRMADANLAAAFPELTRAQRRAIRRRSAMSIARTMIELLKLPRLSKEDLAQLIVTPDLEPLREAVREGPGVLFIAAHFGNWELMAAHLAHQVTPLTVIARDASHSVTASLINRARESHGTKIIGRRDTREMLRVLTSHGMLGMLPDQHAAEGGMLLEFLGRPAWTFTGPALLASRTGARVFAGFCIRDFDGPFRMVLLPEITLVNTGDRDADVVTNTRLINATIEQAIREHPDNWLWLHNRWKQPRRLAAGA